jgi:hypothetical protein
MDKYKETFNTWNNIASIYQGKFVEGDPEKSDFKLGSGGRVYFYFHNLDNLKTELIRTKFDEIKTFEVKYKVSETEFDIHTILTARKKNAL